MSFYDWYCDLPPASPQVWGEQTDVPESADWYNSTFIIAWGSNVPQTRTPDAHFFTEVRYKGAKTVAVTPDYAEVSKLADLWLHPKQGTDAALAMAMGHVILKEFHVDRPSPYFVDYCRRYTDMPMLVRLVKRGDRFVPDRYLRASEFADQLGEANNPEWKTVAVDEPTGKLVAPHGSIGFRWGQKEGGDLGKWNLEARDGRGADVKLALSLAERPRRGGAGGVPVLRRHRREHFTENDQGGDVLLRNVPAKRVALADGEALVATVYDLRAGQLRRRPRPRRRRAAKSFDDDVPYTPKWQEKITGVKAADVITVARQFADNADKTHGKSMIIIGAAMNHWFHSDMNYRGVINLLMMCGCVGQSGGGWAHYVGQEKLRPQTGWTALAFALDWHRPPRQQNSTSFFYAHTDQWRYEKLDVSEILSPLADPNEYTGSLIDFNVRAERMGWLPSAPGVADQPDRGRAHRREGRARPEGLRGRGAEGRHAQAVLRGPGQPGELPAQPVRVALEPAGQLRQGPRVLPQAPARHHARRAGQGPGRGGRPQAARRWSGATRRRRASSTCW